MQLRWSTAAENDLEEIDECLYEKSLQNAAEFIRKNYEAPSSLQNYPNLGRPGKKEGTRELVIGPLAYTVVYKITGDALNLLRILHGDQDWPR